MPFNVHLIWAEEVVLLLVPWLAMTGVFLAVRRGTMIRIEYFFEKLPGSLKRWVASAGHVVSIAVLAIHGLDLHRLRDAVRGRPDCLPRGAEGRSDCGPGLWRVWGCARLRRGILPRTPWAWTADRDRSAADIK